MVNTSEIAFSSLPDVRAGISFTETTTIGFNRRRTLYVATGTDLWSLFSSGSPAAKIQLLWLKAVNPAIKDRRCIFFVMSVPRVRSVLTTSRRATCSAGSDTLFYDQDQSDLVVAEKFRKERCGMVVSTSHLARTGVTSQQIIRSRIHLPALVARNMDSAGEE